MWRYIRIQSSNAKEAVLMTAWLIRKFVPDAANTTNPDVRAAYGTLASIVGILVNLLLAAAKFAMGILSGSLAVTADAANNLSDAAGSVVALISVRLARKPVDLDHPFGHGRMEYLGSLAVGVLIVIMGVTLLRDAVTSLLHPEALTVSWVVVAVLALSILGKLWLYLFYRKTGDATKNGTLLAAAQDSRGDMLATGAVLVSLVLNAVFGLSPAFRIDGIIGLVVAFIVLKVGWGVCSETLNSLLGGRPDPEKTEQLRSLLLARDGILGLHDLVLHDYGPGRCFASVHAEVDAAGDILEIHELIDDAEREVGQIMQMPICIHMDPIVTTDERVNCVREQMSHFLTTLDPALSMHDFRMVPGEGHTNLIFDCVLPAGYQQKDMVLSALNAHARSLDPTFRLVVMFDTDFT